MSTPIEVFIVYANEDEQSRQQLEKHLTPLQGQGHIIIWHRRKVSPGANHNQEIHEHLNTAGIILPLLSHDFIDSDDYDVVIQHALARLGTKTSEPRIIPIILSPCDWTNTPFGRLEPLPRNHQPILAQPGDARNAAFLEVAEGIREVVSDLNREASLSNGGSASTGPATSTPGTTAPPQPQAGAGQPANPPAGAGQPPTHCRRYC